MGIQFDIRAANWVAYLIQPEANLPSLGERWVEKEALRVFLHKIREGFFSSTAREQEFRSLADSAVSMLDRLYEHDDISGILQDLRRFLAHSELGRKWTALIIPSGRGIPVDYWLCSCDFLRRLVNIRQEDPGLILQLTEPPHGVFSLTDVFHAFKTALNESLRWPGVLLWTRLGDSVFLPFGSLNERDIEERAVWIFSH